MLFVAKLAQQRSPAAAALLFLLLVDEIEGLIFLAVGVLMKRVDLFLEVQDVLFPSIVVLCGAVAIIRNVRRRRAERVVVVEPVDVTSLAQRIGSHSGPDPIVYTPAPQVVRSQWVATTSVTGQRPAGFDVAVKPAALSSSAPYTGVQRPVESEYRASIAALHARSH